MEYLQQRYTMPTSKSVAILTDIDTEELTHLEIIRFYVVVQWALGGSSNSKDVGEIFSRSMLITEHGRHGLNPKCLNNERSAGKPRTEETSTTIRS